MRKKLPKKTLSFIKSSLTELNYVLEGDDKVVNSGFYKKIGISVFDHWLKEEEINQIYTEDKEEIKSRQNKFELSIKELFDFTEIYLWKYKRHGRLFIYKPTSLEEILKICDFKNL
jgi:hypothetical protein